MCGSSRRSTQSFGRGRGSTGPQRTFLETNTRYGKRGHRKINESQLERTEKLNCEKMFGRRDRQIHAGGD